MTKEEIEKIVDILGSYTDLDIPYKCEIAKDIIKALEQEPKQGHWIKIGDRGFGWSDTVICKCSKCGYQKEFRGKFDGHNLIVDTKCADNYCSNCGSKNE